MWWSNHFFCFAVQNLRESKHVVKLTLVYLIKRESFFVHIHVGYGVLKEESKYATVEFPMKIFNLSLAHKLLLFSLVFAVSGLFSPVTQAVTTGKYLYNTRLREEPSLSGKILKIMPLKSTVSIVEEQNEWYQVKLSDGTLGWSMKAYLQKEVVAEKVVEKIQPEGEKGQSGNVIFNSRIRKTPFITNNIIEVVPTGTSVKIVTVRPEWYQVEYNGGKTGWIMSELVVVVTPESSIGEEFPLEKVPTLIDTSKIGESHYQVGVVPDEVDLVELNRYWLEQVNELRVKKDLRQLMLDQRWVDTATEWAGYMGEKGIATHTRPDGKSMHKWIDTKDLDFTVRYSDDGWQTNYFTENIAWGIAQPTTADVKRVLDNTLAFFLAEAPYNGDHYRTTYHKDWNSVGLGFYFQDIGKGKYKVFVAMHYGSLELK